MHRLVAVSQTRPPSPQSAVCVHCTHRFAVLSQRVRSPAPAQFASLVHCTQSIVLVLQAGVPPPPPRHCASLAHDTTQRFVVVSQTRPASPQLAFVTHSTHDPADEQ
jgi:hypothetical protein